MVNDNSKLIEYYERAVKSVSSHPDQAVSCSRKAAELICKKIIYDNGKQYNSHASIEDLLKHITTAKLKVNLKIILAVRTIQLYANYGAHDQSFHDDEVSNGVGYHGDLNEEDIAPCMHAFTQMLKQYLGDSFTSSIFNNNAFDHTLITTDNSTITIGATSLTVPDCIMQGWQCEELFSKFNLKTHRVSRFWNDDILKDLSDNTLDIAIYNKESALSYKEKHPNADYHIIRDVCSSMGGRNFYILASNEGKWIDMTLQQFKDSLGSGVIVAVSLNSDMLKNLLYILDTTEDELKAKGVILFDYHSDMGLHIFEMNKNILLIGGQDLRFLAEKQGGFTEVISYENLPKEKRDFFNRNSVNSLIVSPRLYSMLPANIIGLMVDQLMINFYSNNICAESRQEIMCKLRPQVRKLAPDNETADYIIQRILFETYRFFS